MTYGEVLTCPRKKQLVNDLHELISKFSETLSLSFFIDKTIGIMHVFLPPAFILIEFIPYHMLSSLVR